MRARLGCVLALSLCGCTDGSRTDPDVLPLAPDGVAVVPLTLRTTRVTITWNDLSDNEAAFIVQTSPDGIVWTNVATVSFDVTTADVTGLVPGVQVFIRVASNNAKGTVPSAASIMVTPPLPAWTQIEDGPSDLFWSCSAFDPGQRLMYVFGGMDGGGTIYASLRILNVDATAPPTTWTSLTPASAPLPRFGASLIHDPLGNRLILFGGQIQGSTVSTDELWEYQIGTSTWSPLAIATPPLARQHHTAVYDEGLDRMVVYGGSTANAVTIFDDVAVLTLPAAGSPVWATFTLSGMPPAARFFHTAVYDGAGRRMVIFGGKNGTGPLQDTWGLDLTEASPLTWTPLAPAAPPSERFGHMAVLDSINQQMVVFGGADQFDLPNDEVWTLTLQGTPTWRPWSPTPTAGPRSLGTAVFDPVAGRMIVFGGVVDDSLTTTPETWALGL